MSYSYRASYGQGKLQELQDAPGEYYQLTEPVTPDELLAIAQAMANDRLCAGTALTNPEQTKLTLATLLQGMEREVFGVLFVNGQHQLIEFEILFYGTVDAAAVYPREVVKRALLWNASAVLFCHNHPSGHAEPSQADRRITRRLADALKLVDIPVLDHFVIGKTITSFAERGWL
ncbi:DNA repair protein RadC [Vibrio parahaemolyticus]|nr:DNA repair protein RadC [Vibrio parahaemolyticus]EHK6027573.1 DNA repair protein RadC [Vibrio parahaemolyticus]EIA1343039.1 DNA repair protein RadC [Vibrio parahaemolyticus]EIA1589972.1 DNA repair protein RadC [Vibrio parahaemolyticus]EJE8675321.1 DNA repair protein RadC [Vibrio parahaemolyticus]